MHFTRFLVFAVDPGVADMRIGQRNDLTAIGRVGQDFLVAGHSGVEYHLAHRAATRADAETVKYCPVCEREESGRERGRHG